MVFLMKQSREVYFFPYALHFLDDMLLTKPLFSMHMYVHCGRCVCNRIPYLGCFYSFYRLI